MPKNSDKDTTQTKGVKDCPDCGPVGTRADGSLCQTCGGTTVVVDN